MMASSLLLPCTANSVSAKLHPVIILQIADAFNRRGEKQERVIGTLLGTVTDNVVTVKSCYVVPHNESAEQVALDIAHHKTMYELHQKVTAHEVIVGWFATGANLYSSDALIQEFYSKEGASASSSIHILVDTTLSGKKASAAQAFTSRLLSLGDKVLATEFVEVPLEIVYADIERVGADLLLSGPTTTSLSEEETLTTSLTRLSSVLDTVHSYVNDVVEGRAKGDPALGTFLSDTLAVVPALPKPEFERLLNDSVQDVMTVSYLANLMRTHTALAERLGTAALPIM
ncbi:MAG: hypothetical protein WDW38_010066 [Sanguina aurantia]